MIDKVKFEGIDDFNRPVFKSVNNRNRYGSTDELFSHDEKEKYVLRCMGEIKTLTFFIPTKMQSINILSSFKSLMLFL